MPPEPQAGPSTPRSGSMTLTMVWTRATGVKKSPPSCAFYSANWVRKCSLLAKLELARRLSSLDQSFFDYEVCHVWGDSRLRSRRGAAPKSAP